VGYIRPDIISERIAESAHVDGGKVMVFTRIGSVVAALALVLGLLMSAMGVLSGLGIAGPYEAALARYLPWAKPSGAVFEKAFYSMGFGIALGVMTEIRRALEPRPHVYVRRRSEQDAGF
jgi:hypothetical protein